MDERTALAAEIMRRRIKFADVVSGQYEMLSEQETEMLCNALVENERLRAALQEVVNGAWEMELEDAYTLSASSYQAAVAALKPR